MSATDGTLASSVSLTWSPVPGATRYEVWRHTVNNAAGATRLAGTVPYHRYEDATPVPSTPYYYWVKAASLAGTSAFSAADSGYAGVLAAAPQITGVSPARNVLAPGQTLNLSVTASGTGSLNYQWTHNGRPIAGATGASLPLANVTRQDSGYYLVRITDANGTTRSKPIFVTVAPAVTQVVAWGDNTQGQASPPLALTNAAAVEGGNSHTLALRLDGTLAGWGYSSDFSPLPGAPNDFVAIAAGASHNLALRADGTVVTWFAGSLQPVPAGLNNVVALAAGYGRSYALKSDGTVVAWTSLTGNVITLPESFQDIVAISAGLYYVVGLKSDGTVVGYDTATSTVPSEGSIVPPGLSGVVAIASGDTHSLALKADGTLVAWGENAYGQTEVPALLGSVVAIAVGQSHSLALKDDGTVVAWGSSLNAQTAVPAGLADVFAIAAGTRHSLALRDATADVPPTITTQPQSLAVTVGDYVSFVVVVSGEAPLAYQWRRNGVDIPGATSSEYSFTGAQTSQAGDYTVVVASGAATVTSAPATLVVRTPPVIYASPQNQSVVAGNMAFLSVTATGTAPFTYQWQRLVVSNNVGTWTNLADIGIFSGTSTAALTINPVGATMAGEQYRCVVSNPAGSATSGPAKLFLVTSSGGLSASAAYLRTLFLRADGTLWGSGMLGFDPSGGADTPLRNTPIQVAANVVALSTSSTHALLIKVDGTLWAMGANSFGQLCDGTTTSRTAPIQVATGVVAATAAEDRSYFIKSDGTLWVAGANGWGWFGTGVLGTQLTPVQVARDVQSVAAGDRHVLLLKSDGSLWGAGTGSYGQLGLGNANTVSFGFAQIGSGVTGIAAGSLHSLFIKSDGTLWGMGSNEYGELGDGAGVNRYTPVQIMTGVLDAFGGPYRSLFIKSDGSLWAMGENTQGYLGDGTTSNRLSPVQIATAVVSAGLGASHEVFTKADGSVWSVGNNFNGQLGDGTNTDRLLPVQIASGALQTPAAPAGLVASDASTYTGVHVSWTPILGATHYQLFRNTTNSSAGAALLSSRITPAYFQDTTASPGVTYYYWATSVNPAGTSGFSNGDLGSAAIAVLPVITSHPSNQIYNQHAPAAAVFSVTATGTAPLIYQWRRNGLNLGDSFYVHGAQTPTLSLTDQSTSDAGTITVVVSNGAGSVESNPATLSVGYPPSIYQPPQGLAVALGAPAAFTVVPITDAALPAPTYVWRKDGVVLQGATSPTLSIASTQLADAGSYTVEVANMFGSVTSAPVTLTVAAGFSSWQLAKFDAAERLDAAISGPHADPDHDGFGNLLEYALGLEPKAASTTGLPEVGTAGSDWTYTYSRPSDRTDVTYEVEMSTNLTTWTTAGVTHELVTSGGGTETWHAKYPLGSAANCFFRLKITQP